MGETEKTLLGMTMIGGAIALLGGFIGNKPEVAGLGVWLLIGSIVYAGWRDARRKRKDAQRQPAVEIVPVPTPRFRTEAEMRAMAQSFFTGPKRVRTRIIVIREEEQ
jgi:hypothetical protein